MTGQVCTAWVAIAAIPPLNFCQLMILIGKLSALRMGTSRQSPCGRTHLLHSHEVVLDQGQVVGAGNNLHHSRVVDACLQHLQPPAQSGQTLPTSSLQLSCRACRQGCLAGGRQPKPCCDGMQHSPR